MKLSSNIPIKYHIGAYRNLPSYPGTMDLVFDLILYVHDQHKRKNKFKLEDYKINVVDFHSLFKDELDDEFKGILKKHLIKLRDTGFLTTEDGVIHLTNKSLDFFFKT